MPKANTYEYGQLQNHPDGYFFYTHSNPGGERMEIPIYDVLNFLARSNWEPHLYYEAEEGKFRVATWIMRRTEE